MLNKDPSKRPHINQILKHPLLKERIPSLLSSDQFQEEFSHTVLTGNVFAKKPVETNPSKRKIVDESQIISNFQPSNGLDQNVLNQQFKAYVDHLNDSEAQKNPKNAQNPYREPNYDASGD